MPIVLAGAFALTRGMEAVVFRVNPTDPATYIASSIGLLAAALLATYMTGARTASCSKIQRGRRSCIKTCIIAHQRSTHI